ncbi:hypothetical protein GCM10009094_44540 [Massilia aurea]
MGAATGMTGAGVGVLPQAASNSAAQATREVRRESIEEADKNEARLYIGAFLLACLGGHDGEPVIRSARSSCKNVLK